MERSLGRTADQVRADLVDKGRAVTRNAALAAGRAAEDKDFLFLVELVNSSIIDDAEIVSGSIEDPHGRVLVNGDPTKAGTIDTTRKPPEKGGLTSRLLEREGTPMLEVTAPIQVGDEVWGTLSFGLSHARIEQLLDTLGNKQAARMRATTTATGLGVAAVLLAAALAAWLASRRIVGPLRRITTELERIRAGDLSVRVHIDSCREYRTFSMGINELTATTQDREEQIGRYIKRMQRYAERKDLIAKLEADQVRPKPETIDAAVLVDEVRDSLAWPAREKHLQLEAPPLTTGLTVQADRAMLGQVLYELMSNAIQCTAERGTVGVELEPVERDHERFLRFRIRDTGVGLTKDQTSRMFASGSLRDRPDGVGLGLAIANKMAGLHHGAIWAESSGLGKGAVVTIELPVEATRIPRPDLDESHDVAR
jgi:signal transduction histidine kinase